MIARRAAFIDRDGTLVAERHYLKDPDRVELLPGAARAVARMRAAGYLPVLVTNQSGIARGLYTEAEFLAVQRRLEELLAAEGVTFEAVYHCPHHPDYSGPCDCRKPRPGLFLRAAAEHGIDLGRSVYVGDRLKDVQPARAFGGHAYLVRTGYGEEQAHAAGDDVEIVADLAEAADRIIGADESRRQG